MCDFRACTSNIVLSFIIINLKDTLDMCLNFLGNFMLSLSLLKSGASHNLSNSFSSFYFNASMLYPKHILSRVFINKDNLIDFLIICKLRQ